MQKGLGSDSSGRALASQVQPLGSNPVHTQKN
jgi:hypothetical protein